MSFQNAVDHSFAVADRYSGAFDEARLEAWCAALRGRLLADPVTFGTVFMTPAMADDAAQILEILRVHAEIPLLVGCTSSSLICNGREWEQTDGLVLGLYALPDADLDAFHVGAAQIQEANGPAYWHHELGLTRDDIHGWLAFADPFHADLESWIHGWNEAYASRPILGGLASGKAGNPETLLFHNGTIHDQGVVAIAFKGKIGLTGLVSQGCTPIGQTWTITRAEGNRILEIGNRPAYQVLVETFEELDETVREQSRGNLFVGLVINEYLEEFARGDFLIRNLLAADPESGSLIVGAWPRAGQTLQFQRRDAGAAEEDMHLLIEKTRAEMGSRRVYGGCLCSCHGRGTGLFGRANHDASSIQQGFGPIAVAGFFCNGEVGPIGDHSFIHGYTASLALFVEAASPDPTA